jgi:hypothetical protein
MNELFAQKMEEAHRGDHCDGMDIMGSLVQSSYGEKKGVRKPLEARLRKENQHHHFSPTRISWVTPS